MNGRCEEFDRFLESPPGDGEAEARRRQHLAGCASCRQQEVADALLREALPEPPPELGAGFDRRLRGELERRLAENTPPARRQGGLSPVALWALGAYGMAAVLVSLLVLVNLPWQSLAASPGMGIVLGALVLLSPLVLLDRVGVVRPPG